MQRRCALIFTLAILFALASCAKKKSARSIPPPPQQSVAFGETETGIASWYGEPYHGRRAANGEIYDMHKMTAAHRTMPFGTWVRVDNLTNGKNVQVRVTDRGPFVEGRIIDLSRKAAEKISLIGPGVAKVKLTVIDTPPGEVVEKYGVQVSALESEDEARKIRRQLEERFSPVIVSRAESDEGIRYRVLAGRGTREEARALLARLRQSGQRGIVVRLPQPPNGGGSQP